MDNIKPLTKVQLIPLSGRQKENQPAEIVDRLMERHALAQVSGAPTNFIPVLLPGPTHAERAIARVIAQRLIQKHQPVLIGKAKENNAKSSKRHRFGVEEEKTITPDDVAGKDTMADWLAEQGITIVERWAPLTVVVLAAGQSRRMGRAKQLEPVHGVPMVVRAAGTALRSGAARVLIITGSYADEVKETLAQAQLLTQLRLSLTHNPAWRDGQSTSVHTAIGWMMQHGAPTKGQSILSAAIFMPVDQPYLQPSTLRRLFRAWHLGAQLVAPTVAGTPRGAPALFDSSLWPEMRRIKGDVGAKAILRQHQTELITIPVPADQLLDMDVPDDLPTPSLQSL